LDGDRFEGLETTLESPGGQPTFDLREISLLRWLCLVGETLMAEMKPSLVEGFCVFLGL
jgi:hypothetical protein